MKFNNLLTDEQRKNPKVKEAVEEFKNKEDDYAGDKDFVSHEKTVYQIGDDIYFRDSHVHKIA
jgi:hypothetical protein